MPRFSRPSIVLRLLLLAVLFLTNGSAVAQTVWSGLSLTFTKMESTSAGLEENQDRITDNVWITRGLGQGLLNAATECDGPFGCVYEHNFSPEDTEWANAWLNPGGTIAAANWEQLTFSDWEDAYDNRVGQTILNPLYRDAVVHLITDDIYLDLRFEQWSVQCCGGFSYQRATAPITPEPTGDFNNDGVVDAADYVMWRKEPSVGDYADWVQQFGEVIPPGAGGTAVPEPGAAALLALVLLLAPNRHIARPSWPGVRWRL
jgi:hypothetical protein